MLYFKDYFLHKLFNSMIVNLMVDLSRISVYACSTHVKPHHALIQLISSHLNLYHYNYHKKNYP